MNPNTRIKLQDSTMDVRINMSDGNPGALMVLMEMLNSKVDPDDAMGGLGKILLLDTWGIYGTDIYILHNDICDRKIGLTCAVLRATQLGLFSHRILKDACNRQDRSGKALIPVQYLYLQVKERLPNFDAA